LCGTPSTQPLVLILQGLLPDRIMFRAINWSMWGNGGQNFLPSGRDYELDVKYWTDGRLQHAWAPNTVLKLESSSNRIYTRLRQKACPMERCSKIAQPAAKCPMPKPVSSATKDEFVKKRRRDLTITFPLHWRLGLGMIACFSSWSGF
jgi:hypothetical protein